MHTQTDYPAHIYDPYRREIAVRYIRHELRKLFSHLRDEAAWKTIDADVAGWYKDDPLIMPVRDFWNGLHGISMGFKLKNIVSWLTSANVRWEERMVPVSDLWFGATLHDMESIGVAPAAVAVREWFYDPAHADALAAARTAETARETETMPRNEFPIVVVYKEEKFRVVDGNRRLLRAIYSEAKEIKAVVGTPVAQPVLLDAWVPTSLLVDLVSFHRYSSGMGRDVTASVAEVIAMLIGESAPGRTEFVHRSLSLVQEADTRLKEAVSKRLREKGILLPI